MTLAFVAREAKSITPQSIMQFVDFEKLVENSPNHICDTKVSELVQKRASFMQ